MTCGCFLDETSDTYFRFFVYTQPIIWFFYVAMVWELFGLVLARHKGFSTLGRWAMYLVSAVSVTVSAVSMIHKITPAMPQSSVAVGLIVAIERGLDFSLAIFLILMLFVLSWYTVPLSRNVVAHAVIYTLFFLAGGMSMILRTLFGLKNLDADGHRRHGGHLRLFSGVVLRAERQGRGNAREAALVRAGARGADTDPSRRPERQPAESREEIS